jgi:hypothetical protein
MFNQTILARTLQSALLLCAFSITQQSHGQFTTVLNIPPDPDIGHNQSIGSDTQLNLNDRGSIGVGFYAGNVDRTSTNIEVNIFGGSVGPGFGAYSGSEVNISGGTVSDSFKARDGSVVNMFGGSVGGRFFAFSGSEVNISGISIGSPFYAFSDSNVNLFGTQFILDDVDITNTLTANIPETITDRYVTLSGLLVDGSAFSFDLNGTNRVAEDFFDNRSLLTITLVAVPEPSSGVLLLVGVAFLGRRRGTRSDR